MRKFQITRKFAEFLPTFFNCAAGPTTMHSSPPGPFLTKQQHSSRREAYRSMSCIHITYLCLNSKHLYIGACLFCGGTDVCASLGFESVVLLVSFPRSDRRIKSQGPLVMAKPGTSQKILHKHNTTEFSNVTRSMLDRTQ